MGRAAHHPVRDVIDNRGAMSLVRDEIDAVLRSPQGDHRLEELERILTDGYAEALTIEAETLRLQRQLTTVARALGDGDVQKARELSALAHRLEGRNGDLAALRRVLADLRRCLDALR